jgi:hypothetical protein
MAEDRLRVFRGEGPAGAGVGDGIAPVEHTRADPGVGEAVAVGGVHPCLHLEHERAEFGVNRTRVAGDVDLSLRRRRMPHQGVKQLADAEVEDR